MIGHTLFRSSRTLCVLAVLGAACVPGGMAQSPTAGVLPALHPITPEAVSAEPENPIEKLPSAPAVVCSKEKLSVKANNATLGSILLAVQSCLGITIDTPEGASTERMFADLGPGPKLDILNALLGSTDFNYVIQSGDAANPEIRAVMLLSRDKDKQKEGPVRPERVGGSSLSASRRAWLESRRAVTASREGDEAAQAIESDPAPLPVPEPVADVAVSPSPTAAAPIDPNAAASPSAVDPGAIPVPQTTPALSTNPVQPATGSSEGSINDKITNMQQLFEQRKQMIESQTPATTPKQP